MKEINYLILIIVVIFLTTNNATADSKCTDNLAGDTICNYEDGKKITQTNYMDGTRKWTVRKSKTPKDTDSTDKTENAFRNINQDHMPGKSSSCIKDILGHTICN